MVSLAADLLLLVPNYVKKTLTVVCCLGVMLLLAPYVKYIVPIELGHINSQSPDVFDKVRALKEYVRYSYRSLMYDGFNSEQVPLSRRRASVLGLDSQGSIFVEALINGEMTRFKGVVADIEINDLRSASHHIKLETKDRFVVLDTYEYGGQKHFVVWLPDGTPLNEILIAKGFARPLEAPPTNIVNSLFKRHYYVIVRCC